MPHSLSVFNLFYNFSVVRDKACLILERFSYDLEMKTREWNRNNKRTEIELFDWFIEGIQTRVAFDWLSECACWGEKKLHARELSRNQSILRFDVILQHNWPIEQSLSILGFSLAGKRRVHVLIFSSTGWTLTETIFQGHTKIALTVFS